MSGVKHTYTVYCAQKLISEFILNSALSRARPAEPTYVCMYACFAVRHINVSKRRRQQNKQIKNNIL